MKYNKFEYNQLYIQLYTFACFFIYLLKIQLVQYSIHGDYVSNNHVTIYLDFISKD